MKGNLIGSSSNLDRLFLCFWESDVLSRLLYSFQLNLCQVECEVLQESLQEKLFGVFSQFQKKRDDDYFFFWVIIFLNVFLDPKKFTHCS